MNIQFIPEEFDVPLVLRTNQFRLEPLGPQHNERDYKAWMSSIQHIKNTPGFSGRGWPSPTSLAENLIDIEKHTEDFARRSGFTYSVLDGEEVIGCVYLYPCKKNSFDVKVKSWVVAKRAELDFTLWEAVTVWLVEDWPFATFDYESR